MEQQRKTRRTMEKKTHRNNTARRGERENDYWATKQERHLCEKQEETHVTQLIKQSPEIPEIIELNRERRKQLAEIMLEYPTKREDEEEQQGQTIEERRIYTCIS